MTGRKAQPTTLDDFTRAEGDVDRCGVGAVLGLYFKSRHLGHGDVWESYCCAQAMGVPDIRCACARGPQRCCEADGDDGYCLPCRLACLPAGGQ